MKTFVEDLDATPISKTYGFKSHGRKKDADPSKKGKFLMPGLYKHKGFVDELKKRKVTYNFKGTDRNETAAVVVGIKDKVGCQS